MFVKTIKIKKKKKKNVTIKEPHTNHMILFMLISPKNALPRTLMKRYNLIYVCLDFIQGACTESPDGQVQGATTQPPHP